MSLLKRIFFLILVQQVALMYCDIKAQTKRKEIAYLQTDRIAYVAGESIFYKLYVLDEVTQKRSELSKVGYIVLRSANSDPSLKIRVKIDAGTGNGSFVLPDTLMSGAYEIVAFTSTMKNCGEECFFHKQITIANRFDNALDFKLVESVPKDSDLLYHLQPNLDFKIKTDKAVYGIREKVDVNLGTFNSKANVSVSVFEESKIPSTDKSIVETLKNGVDAKNIQRKLIYHSPETKGKILRAYVIDAKTQKTIKDVIVLLSCIDTIPNLQYAVTNSNGLFQMLLSDYYDGKELFLTIKDAPEDQNWQIRLEDEFAQSEKWHPKLISNNGNYKEFIVKSQNIVYINKSYQLNKSANEKSITDNTSICPQFYHCKTATILPSDFVPLNDFSEIAVELLPQVKIFKEKGKYDVQIYNPLMKRFSAITPAVFLDGVYVDDIDKIIGLGSDQIKKIDIIDNERAFGDLIFSGVISIISKSNEIASTKPASCSFRLKNDSINVGSGVVTIDSEYIQNKNIPVFKQLLYWNANLELNATDETHFEFYTSDNAANFTIRVEGVSENGTAISASSNFQVNNSINVIGK
jgi:hypothetical protein